jgi:hypothetical protein
MFCARHKAAYDTLACPQCLTERAAPALADYQARLLARVIEGTAELPTGMNGVTRHLGLVNDASTSFCGIHLTAKLRRSGIRLADLKSSTICMKCRDQLEAALADLAREQ